MHQLWTYCWRLKSYDPVLYYLRQHYSLISQPVLLASCEPQNAKTTQNCKRSLVVFTFKTASNQACPSLARVTYHFVMISGLASIISLVCFLHVSKGTVHQAMLYGLQLQKKKTCKWFKIIVCHQHWSKIRTASFTVLICVVAEGCIFYNSHSPAAHHILHHNVFMYFTCFIF